MTTFLAGLGIGLVVGWLAGWVHVWLVAQNY